MQIERVSCSSKSYLIYISPYYLWHEKAKSQEEIWRYILDYSLHDMRVIVEIEDDRRNLVDSLDVVVEVW